jgi:small subunit ribosomal protein S29
LTPYTKYKSTHLENAKSGIKKVEVPFTMSPEEAAGIWQIWAKKGWARGEFFFPENTNDCAVHVLIAGTDETFLGALSASSGNIKEFTRGLARNLQALPA